MQYNPIKKIINKEFSWSEDAYQTGRDIKKYSGILMAGGIGCCIVAGLLYLDNQLGTSLHQLGTSHQELNHRINSLNKKMLVHNYNIMGMQLQEYPEQYLGMKNDGSIEFEESMKTKFKELESLINFRMLAEEQELINKSRQNVKDDVEFQDLVSRLGVGEDRLLDSFDRYNLLSQKIRRARPEEWGKFTKEREDLIFELMNYNRVNERQVKFVQVFLFL